MHASGCTTLKTAAALAVVFCLWYTYCASRAPRVVGTRRPTTCAAITNSTPPLLHGRKGLAAKRACHFPVDAYLVIGERNSGTNYLSQLLLKNVVADSVQFLPHELWVPKHWAITDRIVTIPPRTLVLLITRNPYDWLKAMHEVCYCCWNMVKGTLQEFVRSPYTLDPSREGEDCPAVELDPNGEPLRDMRAVRSAKLDMHLHLGMLARPYFVHIRIEDLWCREDPALWLRERLSNFCFDWTKTPQAVTEDARVWVESRQWHLQERFDKSLYFNPNRACERLPATVQTINAGLDSELEHRLGYSLLQC